MRVRWKKLVLGLGISATTILVLFFLGEYWVRNYVLVTWATGNCSQTDEILKFKGVPGSICESKTPEWHVVNKHNSLGLRSPEIKIEKSQDTFRILFLGDSFVQGYGVEEEESFPRLLEKELNTKFGGKPKVEVVNAGVPNYSPLIEYLYLKNEGLKLSPDLVILEFDLTDFSNDLVYSREVNYAEREEPLGFMKKDNPEVKDQEVITKPASTEEMSSSKLLPFLPGDLKRFFYDSSAIYRWISSQLKIMLGQPLADAEPDSLENFYTIVKDDTSSDEKLWEQPRKNISLIRSLLADKSIPFVVSAHPHAVLVDGKEWNNGRLLHGLERGEVYSDRYFSQLANFLYSQNIPFISLLDYFRQTSLRPLYFPFDGHFNTNGHKVAANGIMKELEKLNLIKQ